MTTAPVTVIVPTFNRAPVLRVTLESLRRQTFRDWEAIVVGDGCTDGSEAAVAQMGDPRIRWHNRPSNGGSQSYANNDGVALAASPWIAYLTHDDLWMPWHLDQMLDVAARSGADFVHALCLALTPAGIARCFGAPAIGWGTYAAHPVPPCSWMHRRDIWVRLGGWAEPHRIARSPDIDFQQRAALSGAAFAFAPRLSVLSFPASVFGHAYQNDHAPLHAPFARWIAQEPEWLERELLTDVAAIHASADAAAAATWVASVFAGGNTPETVAAFQEKRRENRRFRGLEQVPAPAPPPVIHRCEPEQVMLSAVGGHASVTLHLEANGLTHAPTVLLDGVPLETIWRAPHLLDAVIPAGLPGGPGLAAVEVLSGGGVSAPAWLRVAAST